MGAIGYSTVMNTRPATLDLYEALCRGNIRNENIEAEFRSCKPGLLVRMLSAIFGDFGNKAGVARMAALAEYTARVEYAFRVGSVSSASATKALVNIQREISAITKAPLLSDSHPDISQALADCMGQTLSFLAENSNSTVPIPSAGRTPADVDWTFGVDMQTSLSQPPANDEMGRRVCAELMVGDRRIRFNLKEFSAGRLSRVVGKVYGQHIAENFVQSKASDIHRFSCDISACCKSLEEEVRQYKNGIQHNKDVYAEAKKTLQTCIKPLFVTDKSKFPTIEAINTAAERCLLDVRPLLNSPRLASGYSEAGQLRAERWSDVEKIQDQYQNMTKDSITAYAYATNLTNPDRKKFIIHYGENLAARAARVCAGVLKEDQKIENKINETNNETNKLSMAIREAEYVAKSFEINGLSSFLGVVEKLKTNTASVSDTGEALRSWFKPVYTYQSACDGMNATVNNLKEIIRQVEAASKKKVHHDWRQEATRELCNLGEGLHKYAAEITKVCGAIRPGKTLEEMCPEIESFLQQQQTARLDLECSLSTINSLCSSKSTKCLPHYSAHDDEDVTNKMIRQFLFYKEILQLKRFVTSDSRKTQPIPDITTSASFSFTETCDRDPILQSAYAMRVLSFLSRLQQSINSNWEKSGGHPFSGLERMVEKLQMLLDPDSKNSAISDSGEQW